jgi:hypothetical protein
MTAMNASYGAVGCQFLLFDVAREDAGESAQRRITALQLLARLTAGSLSVSDGSP